MTEQMAVREPHQGCRSPGGRPSEERTPSWGEKLRWRARRQQGELRVPAATRGLSGAQSDSTPQLCGAGSGDWRGGGGQRRAGSRALGGRAWLAGALSLAGRAPWPSCGPWPCPAVCRMASCGSTEGQPSPQPTCPWASLRLRLHLPRCPEAWPACFRGLQPLQLPPRPPRRDLELKGLCPGPALPSHRPPPPPPPMSLSHTHRAQVCGRLSVSPPSPPPASSPRSQMVLTWHTWPLQPLQPRLSWASQPPARPSLRPEASVPTCGVRVPSPLPEEPRPGEKGRRAARRGLGGRWGTGHRRV